MMIQPLAPGSPCLAYNLMNDQVDPKPAVVDAVGPVNQAGVVESYRVVYPNGETQPLASRWVVAALSGTEWASMSWPA